MEIATVALELIENIIAMVKKSKDASAEKSADILARLQAADVALAKASDDAHAELAKIQVEP